MSASHGASLGSTGIRQLCQHSLQQHFGLYYFYVAIVSLDPFASVADAFAVLQQYELTLILFLNVFVYVITSW